MTPSCLENPAMARSVEGGGSQSQSRKTLNFRLKAFGRPALCRSGRCGTAIHAFCARGVFTGWVETELGSRHAAWHGAKATHPTSVEAATVHASGSTRRQGEP